MCSVIECVCVLARNCVRAENNERCDNFEVMVSLTCKRLCVCICVYVCTYILVHIYIYQWHGILYVYMGTVIIMLLCVDNGCKYIFIL